jgi:hypothetical protein
MDYWAALQELNQERKRLDTLIRTLESLVEGDRPPHLGRRGRKGMPAHERKLVSERMKNYWAARRQRQSSGDQGRDPIA